MSASERGQRPILFLFHFNFTRDALGFLLRFYVYCTHTHVVVVVVAMVVDVGIDIIYVCVCVHTSLVFRLLTCATAFLLSIRARLKTWGRTHTDFIFVWKGDSPYTWMYIIFNFIIECDRAHQIRYAHALKGKFHSGYFIVCAVCIAARVLTFTIKGYTIIKICREILIVCCCGGTKSKFIFKIPLLGIFWMCVHVSHLIFIN